MAQLLAGGFVALGALIFGVLIFILSREKSVALNTATAKTSPRSVAKPAPPVQSATAQMQEVEHVVAPSSNTDEATIAPTPTIAQVQPVASITKENVPTVVERAKPTSFAQNNLPLPAWWHEQFQSLTVQLQYLREHAKDVEQQIAILSEIARLAAELEAIQSKHVVLSDEKPLQFPRRASRETMDSAYLTDKRPAVRKYTIKAM